MIEENTKRGTKLWLVPLAALLLASLLPEDSSGAERPATSAAMAESLAALRTEINDLDASLRSRRTLGTTELRGLQTRASELALAEDAERIRVQGLQDEVAALDASVSGNDERDAALRKSVREALATLRKVVERSLPYKLERRLAALAAIGRELEVDEIDADTAAARIWRFVEDERRLASTVELADVSLTLGGDEAPTLVRVVRVGTVALFVYAGPKRWGRVVRKADGAFGYFDVVDREAIAEIRRLFQSVEKQIREGRYRLPLFQIETAR
jgi:hypothetical protein